MIAKVNAKVHNMEVFILVPQGPDKLLYVTFTCFFSSYFSKASLRTQGLIVPNLLQGHTIPSPNNNTVARLTPLFMEIINW